MPGMFRRRRFRRFRARRRFSRARSIMVAHSVDVPPTSLAAAATTTITLIEAADTPTTTLESDGTNIAQCDNRSLVFPKRLKLVIAAQGTPADPIPYALTLWKDGVLGGLANPTTAEDVVAPVTTVTQAFRKKMTCMYHKDYITTQGDKRTFFLRIPKHLRRLNDGESIKITLSNLEATTDNLEFFIQGQIFSRKG